MSLTGNLFKMPWKGERKRIQLAWNCCLKGATAGMGEERSQHIMLCEFAKTGSGIEGNMSQASFIHLRCVRALVA